MLLWACDGENSSVELIMRSEAAGGNERRLIPVFWKVVGVGIASVQRRRATTEAGVVQQEIC
jgi:hypothetical protein